MEKKLVLAVKQVRNAVIGYVVKQDEDLRGKGPLAETGGFAITSVLNPALGGSVLCLRGNNSSADNDVFYHNYETSAGAEVIVQLIKRCVSRINAVESDYAVEDGFEIIE